MTELGIYKKTIYCIVFLIFCLVNNNNTGPYDFALYSKFSEAVSLYKIKVTDTS